MYTEPVIVNGEDLNSRCYVKTYYYGKLLRIYNGKALGIRCFPNQSKNLADRIRQLELLRYELRKRLEKGWNPTEAPTGMDPFASFTLIRCIDQVLQEIGTEDISPRYREDLERIGNQLRKYLRDERLGEVSNRNLDPRLLQRFLSQFNTSSAYYMTKRRTLAGLFSRMVNNGMLPTNPVHITSRKKEVHVLNVAFSQLQVKGLLTHLKKTHPQLHLCALLMYGCFLRPHREIRMLRRNHFDENCSTITLSGHENKSKRIRVIRLPRYVSEALIEYGLPCMTPELYLMSRTSTPLNADYFTTAWTREKKRFPRDLQLASGQTLYSFRHTGAIAVYEKTKDPYKVQQVMFHSSLKVTLTYLRSLGLMSDNAVHDLPDL